MTPDRDLDGAKASPPLTGLSGYLPVPVQSLLRAARPPARLLYQALVLLLVVELVAVAVAPLLITDSAYLRLYLGRRARESTSRFLADRGEMLVYDAVVGWRNRPNAERAMWKTDSNGSRSTHPIGLVRSTPTRLLFLGNSLVNGGTDVAATETISAYVEDSTAEAVNFGTMMYSLDQMYLAYSSQLHRYAANVIVVGLPDDPGEGLTNRYIPLRFPSERNIPFLKPRFALTDTGPALLPVPPKDVYARMVETGDLLDSLRSTDAYYGRFTQFTHFGLTPLSHGMWRAYEHARNLYRLVSGDDSTLPLSVALMRRLEDEARRHDARVVFVLLPRRPLAYPSLWRSWLPDHYARTVAELSKHGFTLLDGRQVLRQSRKAPSELYVGEDYTPAGNRLIAEALRRLLRSSQIVEDEASHG